MKKQDLLKKGTSIALVATIIGSQLLATVPYNVFAAESGVGTQAVPTNSITVSTWAQLEAALKSAAVTDIYLDADITIGTTTNITMTTKNIHGNNHILNANNKNLKLTTAGAVASMEDVRITNTDGYGLFWGDVANLEVTYKNVDHTGARIMYLPTGHFIIDGTVTSSATSHAIQVKDLTIKDNATANINSTAGYSIYLQTKFGSLNVGTNATLKARSYNISIYGTNDTTLINQGNMDLKSDVAQSIILSTNSSMHFQPGSVLKAISGHTAQEGLLATNGNIYVEAGATFEVESKGTEASVIAGSMLKLAQGSNFSITNFNSGGSALGSYATATDVILQSSQGVSTWDRGKVTNPTPTATYPGVFNAQFTLSGYSTTVTQTNLTSNNLNFLTAYKTGATGKIVGGSFASNEQDVAKNAVDALFTDSTKTGIKTTTDQAAIDAAKDLVNKVSDPAVKADLQKDIDKAQSLLDAKNAAAAAEKAKQDAALKAVNELFNNNTPATDAIKGTTDQAAIDAAKALVNAVTDPTKKAELQKDLNRAQELLDAKNAAAATEKAKQDAAKKAVDELFNNNTPSSNAIKPATD
ncbi:toxin Cry1Ac domain D-VI-related protein, partial [Listeria newyorkensis]